MLTEEINYIDPMGARDGDLDAIIRTWFSFSRKRNDIYCIKWVQNVGLEHTKQTDSSNCGI